MATPTLSRHELPGVLGPLLIDVRSSDRRAPRPAVVIVHGFKGFKDWGCFPLLAERLARAGFNAVSVNLSGSGVDQEGRFAYPERFGHNTFSAELEDLRHVNDALANGGLGQAPASALGLVGHSRGGGTAILATAQDSRVRALVTWAAISTVQRWPGQESEWRAKGKLDVVNARTGEVLPLYTDVLDDVAQNAARLDLEAAARRVSVPWLILHGDQDESVPVEEGRRLSAAAPGARLQVVAGAGHTFGAAHPLQALPPTLEVALNATMEWFKLHL
jgi:dienelactone hydrolase